MSDKSTIFYRGNTAVSVDFSAEEISSAGASGTRVTLVTIFQIQRNSNCFYVNASYEDDFHLQFV